MAAVALTGNAGGAATGTGILSRSAKLRGIARGSATATARLAFVLAPARVQASSRRLSAVAATVDTVGEKSDPTEVEVDDK